MTTSAALTRKPRSAALLARQVMGEAGIGIALLALVVVFAVAAPKFATSDNLTNIATEITLNTMLAVGMTFVILVGGIDLSVGSVMALSAVVAGPLLTAHGLSTPVAILLAVLVSALVGMGCGLVNGFVSERWRVPSFIITLGMLNVARGAALQYTNAKTVYDFPAGFSLFGTSTVLGIPTLFWIALAMVAVGHLVLTRTVFGRLVFAIGSNEEAVRLSGHRTSIVKVAVFVISGLTVGIAAVTYMARLNIASPILGSGYELSAIAAVVIGGASLSGGKGSMIGTLLGACLLGVLTNGLLLMGVSDFQRQMITGLVIMVAVVVDYYRGRLAARLPVEA
ncbi:MULTISPECIES: ABC transporter permease [unclassified Kitasatospora]|uniref:ABC transporter permease n=1 Tax=unclassified Kitasatospora TaxID=2633591 RepID=UPI0007103C6B|nr:MULTISPECIES: ABC transporter permease [unclassified Kitasatospora]KQV16780.1 sugar ABC transporter [Kitasatospora sp. Root107]KRB73769.1 sugar ABC transporter [Kitasatospora sp. Root187]